MTIENENKGAMLAALMEREKLQSKTGEMEQAADLGLTKFNLQPNEVNFWLLMDRFYPKQKDNSEMWLGAIQGIVDKIANTIKDIASKND